MSGFYRTAHCTDVGIRKATNQDSILLMQAESSSGPVLLAALCDGMGGLAKGELASAAVIRALRNWFAVKLPVLLRKDEFQTELYSAWNSFIGEMNLRIADYGRSIGANLGTTVTMLLFAGENYYIANVGDTRVYLAEDQLYQLTKDQTLVQKEVDEGKITPEQAACDPRRSVLLQCVGASAEVVPDFLAGSLRAGQQYLICCDGFRHNISPNEIFRSISSAQTESEMKTALQMLVDLNKQRQETDNITAILIGV